jgi:hypothetical protein
LPSSRTVQEISEKVKVIRFGVVRKTAESPWNRLAGMFVMRGPVQIEEMLHTRGDEETAEALYSTLYISGSPAYCGIRSFSATRYAAHVTNGGLRTPDSAILAVFEHVHLATVIAERVTFPPKAGEPHF